VSTAVFSSVPAMPPTPTEYVPAGVPLAGTGPPVPVRLIVCGLPTAPSAIVRMPVRAPTVTGEKVTLMVQVAAGSSDVPHVLVWAKSPDTVIVEMLSASAPGFESETTCTGDVVLTTCVSNVRDAGNSASPAVASATTANIACPST